MKIINESYAPQVGPFYVIDGAVFDDTESVRDLIDHGNGFKDSDNSHYDFWKYLQRVYREFRTIDYDYYPRGRVVYNTKDDTYYLYLDKCIQNMKSIRTIISELNLPLKKVEVKSDEHYQCHECSEDYIGISENYEGED